MPSISAISSEQPEPPASPDQCGVSLTRITRSHSLLDFREELFSLLYAGSKELGTKGRADLGEDVRPPNKYVLGKDVAGILDLSSASGGPDDVDAILDEVVAQLVAPIPCRRVLALDEFKPPSSRWAELPPRHMKLGIILRNENQYEEFYDLFITGMKNPWKKFVVIVLTDCSEYADSIKGEVGKGMKGQEMMNYYRTTRERLAITIDSPKPNLYNGRFPLWSPNPVLENWIKKLKREIPKQNFVNRPDCVVPGRRNKFRALDLGCGLGGMRYSLHNLVLK